MNELIKVEKKENGQQAVDARDLHEFLDVKTRFNDWMERSINDFGFEELTDYEIVLLKNEKNLKGGRPSKEYAISVSMAKELSMVARSDKGKQARRYFIECEKKLRSIGLPNFTNPAEAAIAWAKEYEEKRIAVEKQKLLSAENDIMKPKADFYDEVADSKDAIELGKVAKIIGIKKLGRNKLFELLRDKKILMRNNIPYQKYVDMGYFRTIEQKYSKPDGSSHISIKTLVYQRGIEYIIKIAKKEISE
jgi:anti-repressor protein